MIDWIDTKIWSKVDTLGSQFYIALPLQVPNKLKQTFPQEYKFGLNLIWPLPVVVKLTFGGLFG